jgi:hypothetical protein
VERARNREDAAMTRRRQLDLAAHKRDSECESETTTAMRGTTGTMILGAGSRRLDENAPGTNPGAVPTACNLGSKCGTVALSAAWGTTATARDTVSIRHDEDTAGTVLGAGTTTHTEFPTLGQPAAAQNN